MSNLELLEQAFNLVKSGEVSNVEELCDKLEEAETLTRSASQQQIAAIATKVLWREQPLTKSIRYCSSVDLVEIGKRDAFR